MKNKKLLLILSPFALIALCCGGLFAYALVDVTVREVGFLPTYTPAPKTAPTLAPTSTGTPTPTYTPSLTYTPLPIGTSTSTPPPTDTPLPTNTLAPTNTPTPTSTSAPSVAVEKTVNLRSGPGKDYKVVGTLPIKQNFEIIGRNADSSWWQISVKNEPVWVAADVVKAANVDQEIEVVEVAPPPPTPTPLPSQTPTAVPTLLPLPAPRPTQPSQPVAVCSCSGDSYNCSDGGAVACFHYCQSIGAGDPHRLDRDNDGAACESN